jgi:hypothetical protein
VLRYLQQSLSQRNNTPMFMQKGQARQVPAP